LSTRGSVPGIGTIGLGVLVAVGLWSGAWLSWRQFLSGEACPLLGPIPACYLALGGYVLMAAAATTRFTRRLRRGNRSRANQVFWMGWAVAGGLALLGSIIESIRGDICPRIVLPLCYVSLASCALIGLLYMRITRALDA